MRLTGEISRRRSGRGFAKRASRAERSELKRISGGRKETDRRSCQEEIEFGQQFLCRLFLLGFFSFGDKFTERAGMLAIEGFDERLLERVDLRIARNHRHPGDGLEDGPVSAQHKGKRQDRQPIEQSRGHGEQARVGTTCVNEKVPSNNTCAG